MVLSVGLRGVKKYSLAAEIQVFMSNLYLIRCGGRSDCSNASRQQGNFHHVQGELKLKFFLSMPLLVISCRRHYVSGLSMHVCICDHLLKAC